MGGTGDNTSNNVSQGGRPQGPKYSRRRELLILVVALIVSGLLFAGIYGIWRYERRHPSTEDALLRAHYVWIKPQVTGQLSQLFVKPNQFVHGGDPLFQIDPRPYQEHLAKAEKELVLVHHEIDADKAAVEAAQARVKEQEAVVATARQYAERYRQMVRKGASSELSTIKYENDLNSAQEKLLEIKAKLQQAVIDLGDEKVQQARVEKAEIQVRLAKLNLEWTRVTAPMDGLVTVFELRTGDVVQPGDRLFPFIETSEWWVQANFKETQLEGIRPGMPVTVTIDIYGERRFRGVVESISGSAAAAFSLLPAQNTTGNWVKVTQRIPVRIRMLTHDPEHPYRMGASAEVTVEREAPLIEEYTHPDKAPRTQP